MVASIAFERDGIGTQVREALPSRCRSSSLPQTPSRHGKLTGRQNGGDASALEAGRLFLSEAISGAAAGWIACATLRSIDEHNLEVLITLALVRGG